MLTALVGLARKLVRVVFPMAVGLVVMAQFCEPGAGVTYRNETNETLFIEGVAGSGELRAGGETSVAYIENSRGEMLSIVLTDESGCVAWSRETTLAELRREDLRIVLRMADLIPKDQRTDCQRGGGGSQS